jgi:large subunit ribosomal protein L10
MAATPAHADGGIRIRFSWSGHRSPLTTGRWVLQGRSAFALWTDQEVYTVTLRLDEKQALVAEVNAVAATAHSAIAAEYRGLTVEQLTKLRVQARKNGVFMKVVKNTLAKRAVMGTSFECLTDALKGPLILAFSKEDPGAAARVVKDFSKDNEQLVVTAVAFGGKLLPKTDLERLAKLPTREQALATLMAVMKAPITKFVRTLAEPHAKLVRTVAAVRDQKQAA